MIDFKKLAEQAKKGEIGKTVSMKSVKFEKKGDSIVGKCIGVSESISSKFGQNQKEYVIENDTGLHNMFLNQNADKALATGNILGHFIYVEYQGKINLTDGRTFKQFELVLLPDQEDDK
jgi:hypothetical protein